jgi:glutamine synthetase
MAKSIAEKHGLRATFMPKPFANLTGNGCHTHVSLWKGGTNLFEDPEGELGCRKLGYQFIGGMMAHRRRAAAITNPTVNSATSASTRRAPCRAPPGRPTPSPGPATTAPT